MAKNTKTPVMILQELAVKNNTIPEYELIYSQQGTHENTFHYKVTILHAQAIGIGRAKKEAKHEAASEVLKLLAERGIVHPDGSQEYITKTDVHQDHFQTKAPVNCIPKLLDICVENKIPIAQFFEISAVGPAHSREFTYECHIASIVTRATAGSKKHAKQVAAKEMLNRIINVIPEIQQECVDQLMITHNDQDVIDKFTSLSKFVTKTNFNSKVKNYDLQFLMLMKEICIDQETVINLLRLPPSKDILKQLLNLFDLEYELSVLQESPPMAFIVVNADTPLTIIESGNTIQEASEFAIQRTMFILKEFLT